MFKKIFVLTSLLALVFTPSFFEAQAASDNLKFNRISNQEITQIIGNLQDKDPQRIISQELVYNGENWNELVSNQQDLQVKFNLKSKKMQILNKYKGDISIKIPDSDQLNYLDILDNKLLFSGESKQSEIVVEAVEGGLRQVINIRSGQAPSFYDFPVELGLGDKLELTEQGAVIKNEQGKKKVFVAKPWAIDANKKELKTWHTVENGTILRQHIDFTGAAFPVVADPTWCGNQIDYVNWIERNGVWSASVHPTWCGRWLSSDVSDAWTEVIDKTPSSWFWNKEWGTDQYWSMYHQFACHYGVGYVKEEWNLEPSKPDKGYWGFTNFWDQCN